MYRFAVARGRIYKRNGGYAYRVDLGRDPATGRRRQRGRQGFRTKREAEAALDELLSEIREGRVTLRSNADLGSFLAEWLAGQRSRLKPTTLESYRIIVDRVDLRIGRVQLQALTAIDLERFYGELAETGGRNGGPLAAKTIRNTHTVMRKALSDAERLGLIVSNPAAVARPPVPESVERETWCSDTVKEFLAHVAADRLYAVYVLLLTTGMRRGEVLGLRWRDLDLDGAELHIVQTLVSVRNEPVFSTPKTKRSRRLIYLDPTTVESLRTHRTGQRKERLAAGPVWKNDAGLVFCDETGGPLDPERLSREFRRHLVAGALPPLRLHDLRHTYATLALKAGVHPKIVSDRLGHASVGVTLDLYSHVTPSIGRDAADVVASRIFS